MGPIKINNQSLDNNNAHYADPIKSRPIPNKTSTYFYMVKENTAFKPQTRRIVSMIQRNLEHAGYYFMLL